MHTVMARALYPGKTDEEILASKSHKDGGDVDMYTRGKQGVFSTLYGGDHNTIHNKLSIPLKLALKVFTKFCTDYAGIAVAREEVAKSLTAIDQPGGRGTQVIWSDPEDYCETFMGFRRYFTLENSIIKAIFGLANDMPREWEGLESEMVRRREHFQTAKGATASALYAAAFNLQAANIRAGNNHKIQSPGAQITKAVQVAVWQHQPVGVAEWHVAPLNIHDEVMTVCKPEVIEAVTESVRECVVSFREQVPLISMTWARNVENWADKDGKRGGDVVAITHELSVCEDEPMVSPLGEDEL
jgi:DNA polymerase I-like protein with 3'-5' exonuclease and polymerase domains